jgi:hypothetical protein
VVPGSGKRFVTRIPEMFWYLGLGIGLKSSGIGNQENSFDTYTGCDCDISGTSDDCRAVEMMSRPVMSSCTRPVTACICLDSQLDNEVCLAWFAFY